MKEWKVTVWLKDEPPICAGEFVRDEIEAEVRQALRKHLEPDPYKHSSGIEGLSLVEVEAEEYVEEEEEK